MTDLSKQLEIVNVSDTGQKRPHNEDSTATDPNLGLAIVADGMGGYKAGEVASAIAVSMLLDLIRGELLAAKSTDRKSKSGIPWKKRLVKDAIVKANSYIHRTAKSETFCQGMGTTVVLTLFHDGGFIAAHVGDSRIYRFRGGALKQITRDHSLIQELIDRGFFTPEEATQNTPKNLVTRALGIEEEVEPDIIDDTYELGDVYLLCSDGLTDMVTDEMIQFTIEKHRDNLTDTGRELIRLANEGGGKDNISVVLIKVRELVAPENSKWYSKLFPKSRG